MAGSPPRGAAPRVVPTTAVERALLEAATAWSPVDGSAFPEAQRTVSADLIRELCVGDRGATVDPRGLLLRGAKITGRLDLSYCEVTHPLGFVECTFDEEPDVARLRIPALSVDGCELPGLRADSIDVRSSLSLERSTVTGEVSLLGASVGADLILTQAVIEPPAGMLGRVTAIRGKILRVGGSLVLGGARIFGQVRIPSASVVADLTCEGATLACAGRHPDGRLREPEPEWPCALIADGMTVGAECNLKGLTTLGELSLIGARGPVT